MNTAIPASPAKRALSRLKARIRYYLAAHPGVILQQIDSFCEGNFYFLDAWFDDDHQILESYVPEPNTRLLRVEVKPTLTADAIS